MQAQSAFTLKRAHQCSLFLTCKSCSRQALLQLKDVPRGLCSTDPVLRPWERTDASGLLGSFSKPRTVT